MKIVKDGNAYCVQADNFRDLAESEDYFFVDEAEGEKFIGIITAFLAFEGMVFPDILKKHAKQLIGEE